MDDITLNAFNNMFDALALISIITIISLASYAVYRRKKKFDQSQIEPDEEETESPEEERRRNRYDDLPSMEDFGHHL